MCFSMKFHNKFCKQDNDYQWFPFKWHMIWQLYQSILVISLYTLCLWQQLCDSKVISIILPVHNMAKETVTLIL